MADYPGLAKKAEKVFSDYPYLTHLALEEAYKAGYRQAGKECREAQVSAYVDDLRGL